MTELSKYHVLLYIEEHEVESVNELLDIINQNIRFEDVTRRVLKDRLRKLDSENLISNLSINRDNKKVFDVLGFIYWSKHRDIKWEKLLEESTTKILESIVNKRKKTLQEIAAKTGLTRQTASKYIDVLEENKIVEKIKQKPITVKPLINDISLFYINYLELELGKTLENFKEIEADVSDEKLKEEVSKIHTYSTTVTEGNTATEKEVEKVLGNFSTDLTPREILEIENSNAAIEKLFQIQESDISIGKIKKLNKIVTHNLIDEAGEINYGRKRIAGSTFTSPNQKHCIDNSLKALENFIQKYKDRVSAETLGSLAHFLFVSIHPFKDGNGRTARLLHSWILLKDEKTLFIYNPDLQQKYFQKLQEANEKDATPFIEFCIEKHREQLQQLKNKLAEQ